MLETDQWPDEQLPMQELDFGGQQEDRPVGTIRVPSEDMPVWTAAEESEDSIFHATEKVGYQLLLIDSGAFEHVCPLSFGKGLMHGVPRHIISASGSKIHYYGVREVKFKVWGKDDTKAKFVVAVLSSALEV